jgi:HTH-type transcriptional regulator/antitoxin HigA
LLEGEKMEIKIIKSKKQYHTYLERMNEIFDAKKGTLEYDELDLLALVLEKYEEDKFPIKEPSPLEAIRFIMEQNNLSDEDLGKILKSRSRVTELFNGERKLALSHIRALHSELHIPAKTLIQEY